jgi:hypothetical protein
LEAVSSASSWTSFSNLRRVTIAENVYLNVNFRREETDEITERIFCRTGGDRLVSVLFKLGRCRRMLNANVVNLFILKQQKVLN